MRVCVCNFPTDTTKVGELSLADTVIESLIADAKTFIPIRKAGVSLRRGRGTQSRSLRKVAQSAQLVLRIIDLAGAIDDFASAKS